MFTSDLLLRLLRTSRTRLLLCDQESAERCLAAKIECKELEIFVLGEFKGCIPFDRLIKRKAFTRGKACNGISRLFSIHPVIGFIVDDLKISDPYDPNETVSMVFSSGTTGEPKGILLTHLNIYSYLLTARFVQLQIQGAKILILIVTIFSFWPFWQSSHQQNRDENTFRSADWQCYGPCVWSERCANLY